MAAAVFTFPNRILLGEGVRGELASELERLGVRRPLVVTDGELVRLGLVEDVIAPIDQSSVFDAVHANPTAADVDAGLARYRDDACDGVVGLGGGSAIDAAKAIRLLATHAGPLSNYDVTQGGMDRISANLPPMIAIPTTAGTGSEAARGALIQLSDTGRKTAILSPNLLPSAALCDPELTIKLPPVLTAATGMDAFTHGIESYLSTTVHPICDGIALEGLRHVRQGLEAAVKDGTDIAARRSMMIGALLCGISFHKGLGVVHSLSHALGAEGRVHHGTLNAILLPHAIRFNKETAEDRIARLAGELGLGRSGDAPAHLASLCEILCSRLSLPARLGALDGLDRRRIPHYASLALIDHCHGTNPRSCTQATLEDLLDRAW